MTNILKYIYIQIPILNTGRYTQSGNNSDFADTNETVNNFIA